MWPGVVFRCILFKCSLAVAQAGGQLGGDRPMDHLRRIGNRISVPIRADKDGYVGRECPECEGYFKVTPGTGITTGEPRCHCPYCGHSGRPDTFFTKDQIRYARSVALNKLTGAVLRDLKAMEFEVRPRGAFGIGMSMKVEGRPHPVRHYREPRLETEVACDGCSLRYAIYGVFAHCPDCGRHNSRQILDKNLELAGKQLDLAAGLAGDLAAHLVADALENVVSAFDGFGREVCRVHAAVATAPAKAEGISFQNLAGARRNVQSLFALDLGAALDPDGWAAACRGFQKRHLLAHRMGIVDEEYVKKSGDTQARVGRKVVIETEDVRVLIGLVARLGGHLAESLRVAPAPGQPGGSIPTIGPSDRLSNDEGGR